MDLSPTTADENPELLGIFPGDSELALRMREFDWSSTDLGPPGLWPANLRIAVSICLTSRFPILLWWGPNFTVLYNDAYIPFLGESKHPRYLGGLGRECWAEIWDVIGPMLEGVRSTGKATWSDAFATFFARKLPREEVYVRFTYSPILASDGRTVEGIFTPCTEITDEIIGARRLETLRRLNAHAAGARTIASACDAAARVFAENPDDIPFAAIYVGEDGGTTAGLQAAVYPDGDHRLPEQVTLAEDGSLWPLRKVLAGSDPETVDLASLGLQLRGRRWPDTIRSALLSPISAAQNRLSGILVFGTNPRRPLDSSYRTFFDLMTLHVTTAIADALGYQDERRRSEELAELDRAKTAFFSNISHEFRTPLTLMLGPLEDWEKQANGSVTVSREDLDLLHRNTRRLLRLVNSLLDFSRIEAGRMEASYERTDLSRLTTELASSFESAAGKAGLRLTIVCPPIAEPVYVDQAMWEKIVLNLVSNALKFTFEGEVAVALTPVGAHVELSVSDTGIGIPEQDLPRLFDRFYQVKGALGRTHEGSGIGLALVRDLVKLHSGAVRVESVLGAGSRFTVSIPLGRAHLPVEHVRDSGQWQGSDARAYADDARTWMRNLAVVPAAEPEVRQTPGRPRILIADDNFDMRKYMRRLLSGAYHVDEAADGEAALEMALAAIPDLVISDVMMPRMDGFALLEALRGDARTERVPVILLSARAGEESHMEGLLAGADDYLVKPFSARELLARVSSRLDLAQLHREAAERESFIERIAELTPVVISVFDLASRRITYVSRDVVALLGYTSEEIREMEEPLAALAHPDDVPRCQQWLSVTRDRLNGEICEIEHQVRRRDGEWRWFSSRLMLFSGNHHGVSQQVVTATVDITARKRADEALRSSEERFRSIFELGLIGMAITSPDKGVLAVNDELCRILGYKREELLTRTWAELTHADDVASDVTLFERVMAGEIDGYSMDKRWIRKDGRVVESTISVKCVRDKDGAVDYIVALLQDITTRKEAEDVLARSNSELEQRVAERTTQLTAINQELTFEITGRKRVEEQLRRSEAYLAEGQRISHTGSWAVKLPSEEVFWSEEMFHIYGLDATTTVLSQQRVLHAIHPDDRSFVEEAIYRAIREKTDYDVHHRAIMPDGSFKYLHVLGHPVMNEIGDVTEYVGTVADITERKRAEDALQNLHAELAYVARVTTMGELAAAIAHEVNQPLGAIANNASVARQLAAAGSAATVAELCDVLSDIVSDSNRASSIVARLRGLVKRVAPSRQPLEISAIIRGVLAVAGHDIAHRRIAVDLQIAEDLPRVLGDRVQCQQLILNLVMNAADAMNQTPVEQRALTISARSSERDGQAVVLVTVRDFGCGFGGQDPERLFDALYTTKKDGMGMGLRIARSIAEANGGHLWAESNEDVGATFFWSVPIAATA